MNQQLTNSHTSSAKNLLKAIVVTGLLAGFLDITGALIHYYTITGKNPIKIFPYIASAVFGKKAFNGDTQWIFFGLVFHFLIAFIFTAIFFLVYPRARVFSKNKIITGLVYGLLVWFVMSHLIVPMTNAPQSAFDLKKAIIGALIIMCCIGLPIALMAHKYYLGKRALPTVKNY